MRVKDRMLERRYVLKEERDLPQEEQTVFMIRGLTYDTQTRLQAQMSPTMSIPGSAIGKSGDEWEKAMADTNVNMIMSSGGAAMQFAILDEGLITIENLIDDSTGEAIDFPKTSKSSSVKKGFFSRWIPEDVRIEVANEITKASTLADDDVKNL